MTSLPSPEDVLDFWFSAGPQKWFAKDDDFDADIIKRFSLAYQHASEDKLDEWASTTQGLLALIVLLDQFPRNMFRGSPKTFATDEKALDLAKKAIDTRVDAELPRDVRQWIYIPFMHAEDLDEQERCVALFTVLENSNNLKFAIEHRDIIKRFKRFPHRNAVLGRTSTEEELAFLADGGFAG